MGSEMCIRDSLNGDVDNSIMEYDGADVISYDNLAPGEYYLDISRHTYCYIETINFTIDDGELSEQISSNIVLEGDTFFAEESEAYTYRWFNCDDNVAIENQINSRFTALNNGNYNVEITDNTTGCIVVSDCISFVDTVLSIDNQDLEMEEVNLYPNPSEGSILSLIHI